MHARVMILAVCAAALSAPALAAVLDVTSNADAGPGTLRGAIEAAAPATGSRSLFRPRQLPSPWPQRCRLELRPWQSTATTPAARSPSLAARGRWAPALPSASAVAAPWSWTRASPEPGGRAGSQSPAAALWSSNAQIIIKGQPILTARPCASGQRGDCPRGPDSCSTAGRSISGPATRKSAGWRAGAATIALGDRRLTIDQDANTSFAGTIEGAGGLTKDGAGRLTLEEPQAWTGGTRIAGGILEFLGDTAGLRFTGSIEITGGSLIAPGVRMGTAPR